MSERALAWAQDQAGRCQEDIAQTSDTSLAGSNEEYLRLTELRLRICRHKAMALDAAISASILAGSYPCCRLPLHPLA